MPFYFTRLIVPFYALACRILDTITSWRIMPDDIVSEGIGKNCRRVVADITDAAVFNEDPVFGLMARVSEEEARRTSATSPLRMAFMLYWDGCQVSAANHSHHRHHCPVLPRPHHHTPTSPHSTCPSFFHSPLECSPGKLLTTVS